MTDIFISYSRRDRDRARVLAELLVERGYVVWWDVNLLAGQQFADEINAVIENARIVLVLWTRHSVASRWVKSEAALALKKEKLVPVWLEQSELPAPFNTVHTIDISAWSGSRDDPTLEVLFTGIVGMFGSVAQERQIPNKGAVNAILEKPAHEVEFWMTVSTAKPQTVDKYRAYLERFGSNGAFAVLAGIRIEELQDRNPRRRRLSIGRTLTLAGVVVGIVVGVLQIKDMLRPKLSTPGASEPGSQIVADPITLAQGRITLSFSRVLRPDEFTVNSESVAAIKSPLTSQAIVGAFTIQKIQPFVPPPLTEPGKPGTKRWTEIDITFDNSPGVLSGNLDRLSASTFNKQCDYLVYRGLRAPVDVTVGGSLSLLLNGIKRVDAYIPVHYFKSGDDTAIFVPLNDAARAAMDEYRMFNPNNGFLSTNLP